MNTTKGSQMTEIYFNLDLTKAVYNTVIGIKQASILYDLGKI